MRRTRIGIEVDSSNNTIGGTSPNTGNVLSGNTQIGLALLGANGGGNFVIGNYIGISTSGTLAVPNGVGLYVTSSTNLIGGQGLANVISGSGRRHQHGDRPVFRRAGGP